MIVEMRPIDSIRPYLNNPRKNEMAIDAVARSIKEFGFRQPIVVDGWGEIIVGHTRWKAAKQLGMSEVPVHIAEITPEQARAYRIADNQTNTIAGFDDDMLVKEIMALKALDFDIDALGFSNEQMTELLAPKPNEGLADPDAVPEPPDEPTTKAGGTAQSATDHRACEMIGALSPHEQCCDLTWQTCCCANLWPLSGHECAQIR